MPSEVIDAQTDWPLPGQDYDNSRTARTSRISSANVDSLRKAWIAAPDGLGALSTAPIVIGDTIFVQGATGRVAAIDRGTGKARWISEATGFNIGPFGVAVADGRVFAGDGSSGVVALDKRTGKVLWKHTLTTTTDSLGVDIQPSVFDGMVFASTVPVSLEGIYTPGGRGSIYALDAKTGEQRWSFDTVKGDLWGHPDINSGGGAWYPPAIDIKRRIIYFGIANPAPFPGTEEFPNGSSRPGPNLYTDSVVALDVDNGKLVWFHQVTPHDTFDRDQVHVMLARTTRGRDVVISAGKSGEVVALDRASGDVLWQRAVGKHQNDDKPLSRPTAVYPGTYGGVLTPPAVAEGVAYLAVLNSPTTLAPDKPAYIGSELGLADGEVAAIDVNTGKITWHTNVPGDPLGGATVVNDLVFTALLDGTIVALRRDTGGIVWKYKTDGGINGWLSATADTLYVPVGQSNPPQILALRLPKS